MNNRDDKPNKITSPVQLMGILKKEIARSGFEKNIVQLKQVANDSVEMQVQKVAFDKLMRMLVDISKTQSASITQMSTTAEAEPGIVSATINWKI